MMNAKQNSECKIKIDIDQRKSGRGTPDEEFPDEV